MPAVRPLAPSPSRSRSSGASPLAAVLGALVLAGCGGPAGGPSDTGAPDDSLAAAVEATGRQDYRLELKGLAPDTLAGRARFGAVVDGPTGQKLAVVRLDAGADFGGGFFLLRPGDGLPGPGTYPVVPFPDSVRGKRFPDGFVVVYRRGLLFNLASTEGTVTLTAVSDTLVSGTLTATLAGTVALPGGSPRQGTLEAEGRFDARGEGAGFILGL